MDTRELQEALCKLLGESKVHTRPEELEAVAGDNWFARGKPEAAVFAESTEDVSALLRFAKETRTPVTPRGAGTGNVGGCVPVRGGVVLDVSGMHRILEISCEDFVAVVEPGVITGRLQEEVRKQGLFYPPDPASLKRCSIGGNIATNAGGPRCLKYGVTRQYVLGLEVVLMGGQVVQLGGRTHKNKTGFDLIGLFTGSEGMLGVVTKAILRLLPYPPVKAALMAGFSSIDAASAAVQKIFMAGHLPSAVEVADRFTLQSAREYLGSDKVVPGDAFVMVEIDGHSEGVRAEQAALEKLLHEAQATKIELAWGDKACEAFWERRREFSASLKATGLKKLNEDIVVPRGRLVDLVHFTTKLQEESGIAVASFGHAGDGNIHVNIMVDKYEHPEIRQRADQVLDRLFSQVVAWGGALTGEHGVGLAKKRWWDSEVAPEVKDFHERIKSALDPENLLNPGKFLEGS